MKLKFWFQLIVCCTYYVALCDFTKKAAVQHFTEVSAIMMVYYYIL